MNKKPFLVRNPLRLCYVPRDALDISAANAQIIDIDIAGNIVVKDGVISACPVLRSSDKPWTTQSLIMYALANPGTRWS